MNILVSGVASDVGFGVARILRDWELTKNLFGADIKTDHPGKFICDDCELSPLPSDQNYISWLENYIKSNKINLFVPTSDAEISFLANQGISNLCDAKILINDKHVIEISLDKHECMNFLATKGIHVPRHGLLSKYDKVSSEWYETDLFPIILKPRFGQGSKGFRKIRTKEEFPEFEHENFVWQEYLQPDDREYTCAVYCSERIGKRILIIRRRLKGGVTGSGEIVKNKEIYKYVSSIVDAFELDGVINIQLRLTKLGPILFEINPRLSSTVVFRDRLGFCDLKWWISDLCSLDTVEYDEPLEGTKFYRRTHEYIISK